MDEGVQRFQTRQVFPHLRFFGSQKSMTNRAGKKTRIFWEGHHKGAIKKMPVFFLTGQTQKALSGGKGTQSEEREELILLGCRPFTVEMFLLLKNRGWPLDLEEYQWRSVDWLAIFRERQQEQYMDELQIL